MQKFQQLPLKPTAIAKQLSSPDENACTLSLLQVPFHEWFRVGSTEGFTRAGALFLLGFRLLSLHSSFCCFELSSSCRLSIIIREIGIVDRFGKIVGILFSFGSSSSRRQTGLIPRPQSMALQQQQRESDTHTHPQK